MIGYLKVLHRPVRDAIADLHRRTIERSHARETQRVLAAEVAVLVHGPEKDRSPVAGWCFDRVGAIPLAYACSDRRLMLSAGCPGTWVDTPI